jgi:hypothetical protein
MFTYNGAGVTDKDTVRFLLQDTTEAEHYLEDSEIQYGIDTWYELHGTLEFVAAMLADTIASRYAREVSYSADGVSIGLGAVGEQFRALAASLREQHKNRLVGGSPDAGGITIDEAPDPSLVPMMFGTGMHDDPAAGRQDYGSGYGVVYPAEYYPGA